MKDSKTRMISESKHSKFLRSIVKWNGLIFSITIIILIFLLKSAYNNESFLVLTENSVHRATKVEAKAYTKWEVKNHVKQFVQLMYGNSFETFKDNTNLALHLIDEYHGEQIYNGMKKGGLYELYEKYRMYTEIIVDSCNATLDGIPTEVYFYGKQVAHYSDQRQVQPMGIKFKVIKGTRSDENPHGLIISDYVSFEYFPEDIEYADNK